MPRNFNKYQYETSPRKLEPEYAPKKNTHKGKKSTARKTTPKVNKKKLEEQKKKQRRIIKYVCIGFAILFAISYRDAKIDENFEKVKSLKNELAEVEKENSQLELAIESNMNLSNIEQQAKELLGMQKLTSKQIVYVDFEKSDHIEAAAENIEIKESSVIAKVVKTIKELFK